MALVVAMRARIPVSAHHPQGKVSPSASDVGMERTDEVYCLSCYRVEPGSDLRLDLFLMEHLHCMASLVPRFDFCFSFVDSHCFRLGLGGIEGLSRSAICDMILCFSFFGLFGFKSLALWDC
jgi:hypothetical protein